ncbi:DUF2271 domain-containing protein [Anatilimnocola floriformis]|uniref:DUF2271 domain-containing protein n=1 Tax=Anatilimnocola floriformis TaxID=2948575 RepID=UPI0020C2552A|nr:DUF2271 domain-containing protein [Anatilimnocola floriformis]
MSLRFVGSLSFALLLIAGFTSARAEDFVFNHEHVLGTSLEIRLTADDAATANAAEARILREIERQRQIFSTYEASELKTWQQNVGKSQTVSPELLAMMQTSDAWRERSRGVFNPAAEVITQVWNRAASRNEAPAAAELAAAVKLAAAKQWKLDAAAKTATPLNSTPISFNAIAKGYIVEAACQAALKSGAKIHGLVVNCGGDMRICGDAVHQIAIADPLNAAENAPTVAKIFVNNAAVATSGNYRRGWKIGDKWYSHILDPRNGQPVDHVISATVIAKSSADADALATICNVLPVHESLALVESHNAACLLIERNGEQHKSAGWEQYEQPILYRFAAAVADENNLVAQADDKKATPELLELEVKVELARAPGAQYRRPYVAVWLEDADEFPVRTGLLFMTTKAPGPRWHRDLLRWYKQDNVRKLADDKTNLIDTIASASRGPGEYKAVFDGLDDSGKALKPGKYTLFVEVAREHGTYQIIRQPLELGTKPIETTQMKSNVEVKSASFEYRAAAKKAAN